MYRFRFLPLVAAPVAAATVLFAACGGSRDTGPRRTVDITQTDEACTPDAITVTPGEKISFAVRNDGKKDREVEGVDGMKLEELIVPAGKQRSIDWTAPGKTGTQKMKCYVPGGSTVMVEVSVKNPSDTVNVKLIEFSVTADKASVTAGLTRFVAQNTSKSLIHELAVLRIKDDGSYDNLGEVENIDPGKSGQVVIDLPAGHYLLACLIAPGEAGSAVDHFKQGMKMEFEVR